MKGQFISKKAWGGPIIIIGFGSIGKGVLPLLERHLQFNTSNLYIIDPLDTNIHIAKLFNATFIKTALTEINYREILGKIVNNSDHQAIIINVSVDVSTKDIIKFAQETNSLSVDTSIDPWAGFYLNETLTLGERSNYALRESLLELRKTHPGKSTVVSCCGANPGMVSWLVKQALINLSKESGLTTPTPTTRSAWANLMKQLGVKGIHIAERDTQISAIKKESDQFLNTWSVAGLIFESTQPAELGWGTHEKNLPKAAETHSYGCRSAIYLNQPAATTKVRTWTPTTGEHYAFLITHNEAISISDYYTIRNGEEVVYRPTCHYAYRPSDVTVESLNELFNIRNGIPQENQRVLEENEIISGTDELGVLLYGHNKNAYWYGSQLTIEEARSLAPYQNATGLQVSSAVLAGVMWAINHPQEGLVEADEVDFNECLEVQMPYLGKVAGYYTDWNPLQSHESITDPDLSDPWQFQNIIL